MNPILPVLRYEQNYAMRSGLQLSLMELRDKKFIKTRTTFDTPGLIMPSAFWKDYDTVVETDFFSRMWRDYWGAI